MKQDGTDSGDPLADKVMAWLSTQGYPLEMRVAQEFRKHNIPVVQSDFYRDPQSGEYREIDLVASIDFHRGAPSWGHTLARMCPVIECKSSPGKPWVLFSGNAEIHPIAQVGQRFINRANLSRWDKFAQKLFMRGDDTLASLPALRIEKDPAYSAVRTSFGKNREDAAYGAMVSVSKAAHAVAGAPSEKQKTLKVMNLAIPIIVVDGALFKCKLGDEGVAELVRADRGTVLWRNQVDSWAPPHSIIEVVTESALPDLITRLQRTADGLRDYWDMPLTMAYHSEPF